MTDKTVIIGAGPAGLSAGYHLAKNGRKNIVVLEAQNQVGGLAKTIHKKGYYFDIGPHRFFTKNDEIDKLVNQLIGRQLKKVKRYTPIYFQQKFFDYPIKLGNVIKNLGFLMSVRILADYLVARIRVHLWPKPEKSFEDWMVNRFGRTLFRCFFQVYTEKLWGISTKKLSAQFAAQRIKQLNVFEAVKNAIRSDKKQKIRTLVDEFKYPKYGIGQIYQKMADQIKKANQVLVNSPVARIHLKNHQVISVVLKNGQKIALDELVSSMPITDLIFALTPTAPQKVITAAKKLKFRGLLSVILAIKKPQVTRATWIYVHEPKTTLGRITELKNWSKEMVPAGRTSLIAEMWAFENEKKWRLPDKELIEIAVGDLSNLMGFIKKDKIEFAFVYREPKAYPAYIQGYQKYLKTVKDYLRTINNLQIIGRYGTFQYNNQDHSIETGLAAAKNILAGQRIYDIDSVNQEQEYHEEKK